jgi:hypothetical protein
LRCGDKARAGIYGRDEPVTPSRQGFYKARTFRRIAQHLANLVDCSIQVVVNVDEGVRPQPFLQFLSGHHFAGVFQQDGQDLKGLARKFQLHAAFAQFSRWKVNFEGSEPD